MGDQFDRITLLLGFSCVDLLNAGMRESGVYYLQIRGTTYWYAQYSHFKIYSEAEYYKLEIDGYEGNAGDSLNDPWYGSNNSPFSTYNRDNDRSSLNCASMLKGGWWWKSCGRGLNGLYLHDPQDLTARQGIVWFRWRGWDYTLKRATMMIKPKGLQANT
ncbi:Angiopoietin [Operophtera brumata]|uniref:Angiopoietin n=1 Tax=Operophtera brumata TaxID=104452 RepID=A0A0L7KLN7_OPEBR|nr:Angiopoietin [Operophtera brumata]